MNNERGRKQGTRFRGEMDYRSLDSPPRCGRCRMSGHTRKNCNNPGSSTLGVRNTKTENKIQKSRKLENEYYSSLDNHFRDLDLDSKSVAKFRRFVPKGFRILKAQLSSSR
ncbi:hypothetical protein M9H77_12222 [Catharanthus roseus]|uniref:Uncharacterized protein n=1 Tax=Catharanthus roseus TaxID=4058 RepID=A0ACC0BGZ7_CATRO|nr:hypothetical protein M9H77_12222 [Catharanthus roseus]